MNMAESFLKKYNLTLTCINTHINNKQSHDFIITDLKVFIPDETNSIDSIRKYGSNYGIYFKDGSLLMFDGDEDVFYQKSYGAIQDLYKQNIASLEEIIWEAQDKYHESTICFDCSYYGSHFEPCEQHKNLG